METGFLSMPDAIAFLKTHERHYATSASPIAAIGLFDAEGNLHGAALLGMNAAMQAELSHIYCDGAWQGYSLLYGAAWRAFKALGYKMVAL